MIDDKTRAEAYAVIHAALHGLRTNVITFADFMQTIRTLRKDLEQKQQEAKLVA
jgi:hypothetical protein